MIQDEQALAALARERFNYDPHTGVLTWRVASSYRTPVGSVAGVDSRNGRCTYRRVRLAGRGYSAHRVIWLMVHGRWPAHQIDHINGDGTDNRLCNLREVTVAENAHNVWRPRSTSKTGLRGASPAYGGKFVAVINTRNGKTHLGTFDTAAQAHAAYMAAKPKYHPTAPAQLGLFT